MKLSTVTLMLSCLLLSAVIASGDKGSSRSERRSRSNGRSVSQSVCGNRVAYTDTRYLNSPGYPSNYRDNEDCSWRIRAPFGRTILFDVTDINIEQEPNCSYDYLEIKGSGAGQKFCGTALPTTYVSTTNTVTVRFKSDDGVNNKGFRLRYCINGGTNACANR